MIRLENTDESIMSCFSMLFDIDFPIEEYVLKIVREDGGIAFRFEEHILFATFGSNIYKDYKGRFVV